MKHILTTLTIIAVSTFAQAQNPTAAGVFTRPTVETGDSIGLRIVVSGTSAKPDRVDFGNWAAFLPDEQVLRRGDWQQSGGKWVSDYTLVIFDSVNQMVPPLAVRLLSGDSVRTNPMQLAVMPVRVSGGLSELAAIRGLHAEALAWTDFALLVGGAFALGGIALFFINRKNRRKRPIAPVQQAITPEKPADLPPPTPAHTLALQELARLGREKPWQKGNIKEYYAELSLIVRQYLEARYQISAPESTTREIEAMLRQTGFPKERMGDLRKILEQSDLAKYAQDLGTDRPHETYLLRSEEIIHQTADAP